MSCDMKFDYQDALKRQNIDEQKIIELRENIKQFPHVPLKISNKKVCLAM